MDKEKIEYFKNLLLKKKKEILSRIFEQEIAIKQLKEEEFEIPEEFDDYARIDINELILGELEDIEVKILQDIDKALERLSDGKYGYCEVCGQPIEEKRLEAIPWTSICIKHAKEAEKYQLAPDAAYKDYLEKSLISPYEPLEEDIKEEGFDK